MKKKWFRSMELVEDRFVEEANPARGVTPLNKKWIITTVVASAACLALTLTGLWIFSPKGETPAGQSTTPGADAPPSMQQQDSKDYSAVIEKLSAYKQKYDSSLKGDAYLEDMVPEMAPTDAPMDGVAPPTSSRPGNSDSTYEEITDNQVEGVTEADRIKRSSTHIFYLDGNVLKVFNIAGAASTQVGSITLDKTYEYYQGLWEFYLSADCKTVTIITTYSKEDSQLCIGIVSIDVSDPTNPTFKNFVEITGQYLSSRIIDGKLLLMTEFVLIPSKMDFEKPTTFLPQINGECIPADCIIVPEQVNHARYTIVMKLDEDSLEIEGESASLSYSEHIYVSKDNVFLTCEYPYNNGSYITETEITALSYENALKEKGTVSVLGYVKDQWSMDEYEGVLRVVTTTENGSRRTTNASLYCIDLEKFEVVASVENFAPDGETVRSVRFDKATAYVCTAIQVTDPVYFFDLSDLNNITYKETGNISGFSTSLINLGDGYLLGIGQDNWNTFKVEVYEETATGVVSVCKYLLNYVYYSEEYKSYYIDRENKFVGLGIYDQKLGGSLYLLLRFDGYNLVEVVKTPMPDNLNVMRAVYIDGFLYLFGENTFEVVDIHNNP